MVTLFAIRHIFVPNIPEICRGAQLFIVLRRLSDKVLGKLLQPSCVSAIVILHPQSREYAVVLKNEIMNYKRKR